MVDDFLIPALEDAVTYRRITGDFSAKFLAAAAHGLGPFFLRGGQMKLITNGRFSSTDLDAIRAGTDPEKIVDSNLRERIQDFQVSADSLQQDHLAALAWLLEQGRLEMQVAYVRRPSGALATIGEAEQHQKVGIIDLRSGERIAFVGGVNASFRGYLSNNETIAPFYSWNVGDRSRIQDYETLFDLIWSNQAPRTWTFPIPEACRQELIQEFAPESAPDLIEAYADLDRRFSSQGLTGTQPKSIVEEEFTPWPHQADAIDSFLESGNGVIDMATGTGKTWTAFGIIGRLYEADFIDRVIVATYGNDLLKQWYQGLLSFFDIGMLSIYRQYGGVNEIGGFVRSGDEKLSVLVVSLDQLPKLWTYQQDADIERTLFVCDEVHNLGSESRIERLEGQVREFKYRLGLSATPERPYDDEGNQFIEREIGDVVHEFGLAEAIEAGILCPFDYVALRYSLSEEDERRRQAAFARYSAAKEENPAVSKEYLYRLLADVKKESREKLPVLQSFLTEHPELLKDAIIFAPTKEYGEEVQRIVHRFTQRYHTYYGEDDEANLRRFSKGELDTLVTCKAISEGIDIQSVSSIILMSSDRSKLQTIQRIGRALRTSPDDPSKRATVIDFVLRDEIEEASDDEGQDDHVPADLERYVWLKELSKAG